LLPASLLPSNTIVAKRDDTESVPESAAMGMHR